MRFIVDIDDTLIFSSVDNAGDYKVESYNEDLIEKLNAMFREGHEVILHTGRHWNHLQITKDQLEGKVLYTTLIMGKPVGDYYIDDKAIKPEDFLKEVI